MASTLSLTGSPTVSHGQASRPAVRVLPVPPLEPPTEDELRAAGIVPPSLNAPLLPLELPGAQAGRKPLRRSSGPSARDEQSTGMLPPDQVGDEAMAGPPSPCRTTLLRFLGVVFEVARGFRPASQLRSMCRPDRFDSICAQITGRHPTFAACRTRTGGFIPIAPLTGAGPSGIASQTPARGCAPAVRPHLAGRAATGGPPRTARVDPRGPLARIAVRRLHICDVNEEAAEVSVVLSRGGVVWAVAARMELINGRWLCAHLEIV